MITLKSRKTKLTHKVTADQYEKMKKNNRARHYDVVSNAEQTQAPALVDSWDSIVAEGNKAFEAKEWAKAKVHFEKANKIKSNLMITNKLETIAKKLG